MADSNSVVFLCKTTDLNFSYMQKKKKHGFEHLRKIIVAVTGLDFNRFGCCEKNQKNMLM